MASKYFNDKELSCKCGCGFKITDTKTLAILDAIREDVGKPLVLNSAARCWEHNKVVGSTAPNHPSGKAVDIKCLDSRTRAAIVLAAVKLGIKRIGLAKGFIHIDTMTDADGVPGEAIWFY